MEGRVSSIIQVRSGATIDGVPISTIAGGCLTSVGSNSFGLPESRKDMDRTPYVFTPLFECMCGL